MDKLEFHEYADIFPMMSGEEFAGLKQNIKELGLSEDVMLFEGKILDGRNRYNACMELEEEPRYKEFIGTREDALNYVISHNLHRRHLSTSQRAVIALEVLPLYEGFARERQLSSLPKEGERGFNVVANLPPHKLGDNTDTGKARDMAGNRLNVSGRIVEYAKMIKKQAPEKLADVKTGKETIHKVYRDVMKEGFINQMTARATEKKINVTNLYLGDAVDVLKSFPDDSVDCVVTDPPYGVDFIEITNSGDKTNAILKTHTPAFQDDKNYAMVLLDKVCRELTRVCKPNAHLYFFFGISNYPEVRTILQKHFFYVDKLPLIWVKSNFTLGRDTNKSYLPQYEPIFFCKNKNADRYLNASASGDVLQFNGVLGKMHPTQKPVMLLKHLIGNSTLENEVVLDPFMGSGSTIIAGMELNRQYIGIEKDTKYYDVAKARVTEAMAHGDVEVEEVVQEGGHENQDGDSGAT